MIYETYDSKWAEQTFGRCDLGDPRRVKRLVDIATRLSQNPKGSIARICCGDKAALEGAYKFVENKAVRPEAIDEGVFLNTAKQVFAREVCLAIQDTTTVDISDTLKEGWKEQGSPGGYQVHSTIAVDRQSLEPIGLLDQSRWLRAPKGKRPGKKTRSTRAFEERESYKWAAALQAVEKRSPAIMRHIITVCDREADIYEFLRMQTSLGYRFVVRAMHDRSLEGLSKPLADVVRESEMLGEHIVHISQRGQQRLTKRQQARKARQAREAKTEVRATRVTLSPPKNSKDGTAKPISVNAVLVFEPDPPEETEAISWLLLTTEPIDTLEQVLTVVRDYSARWIIEEFHKAWKTGCRMEQRRLQTRENFERVMTITAAVAIRILQLRQLSTEKRKPCDTVFETDEWQCLFVCTEPGKRLPKQPPDTNWAYYALAKLAGWSDSKRTGRVGWQTLWTGWERLQDRLLGWQAAMSMVEIDR